MTFPHPPNRLARDAAAALALIAVAAPASTAVARPMVGTGPGYSQPAETRPAPAEEPSVAPTVVTAIDDGFQWGSAGIGAGVGAGIVVLSLGAIRSISRTGVRPGAAHPIARRIP